MEYWLSFPLIAALYALLVFVAIIVADKLDLKGYLMLCVPFVWSLAAQSAKRAHDLGHSAARLLIPLYPLYLIVAESQPKENAYGPVSAAPDNTLIYKWLRPVIKLLVPICRSIAKFMNIVFGTLWRVVLRPVCRGVWWFIKIIFWPITFLYRVLLKKHVDPIIERWRRTPPVNTIDWYIIKSFISTYFFCIILILAVVIVFDVNEKIDYITRANKELGVSYFRIATEFYLNTIPYFANLFSSLFVFISVIFFTSKLADRSEIIAMRAAGMSFNRLLRPYIISATFIGLLTLVLGAFIIPHSNKVRTDFENQYLRRRSQTNTPVENNVQLQVAPGVIAFFSMFDKETKSGAGFSLDKFQNKKLVSHLTALRIQYDTISDTRYKWRIYNYQIRQLRGLHEEITSGTQLDTIIEIEPADLLYTRNQQETMTTPEISEYIDRQRERGSANLSTFEVEFHKRFASAFAALILTIIGVSLSCEKRKGGMGISLGFGLLLSVGYILFQIISSTFAVNADWPPMLAAWIPNIIFAAIAFFLYRRTPK